MTPPPGTLLPGTEASISVLGRRPGKSGPPWRVVGGVTLPGLPAPLFTELLIRSVERTLEKEIIRIENVRHANKNLDSVTL